MNNFAKWKSLKIEYPFSLSVFSVICHVNEKAYQSSLVPLSFSFDNPLVTQKESVTSTSKPSNVFPIKEEIDIEETVTTDSDNHEAIASHPPVVEETAPIEEVKPTKPRPTSVPNDTNWLPIIAGVGLLIALLLGGIFWNGVKSNSEDVLSSEKLKMEEEAKRKSILLEETQEKIKKLEQLKALSKKEADRLEQLKKENTRLVEEKLIKEKKLAQLEAKEKEKEKQTALLRAKALAKENELLKAKKIEDETRLRRMHEQRQEEIRQVELRKKEREKQQRLAEEAELNRCVDGRLSAERIKRLVNGKTAYGVKYAKSGKRLYAWKEYQSSGSSGTAYFQREWRKNEKGRSGRWKKYITGKWKVEERAGSDVLCWCYGSCEEYACSYVESHKNCSSWTYTKSETGETKKILKWLDGDKTN